MERQTMARGDKGRISVTERNDLDGWWDRIRSKEEGTEW